MNAQIGFSGDAKLLREIETFFNSHGIKAHAEGIVRASEPKPDDKRRATTDWLTVFAKSADAAKAFFEYLGSKSGEASLRFGTGESIIEITKKDSPQKLEQYFEKQKGFHFDLSIKL